MNKLVVLTIAVVCISGCRRADQDHVAPDEVRPQHEHSRGGLRTEVLTHVKSSTAEVSELPATPPADFAVVRDLVDDDTLDPRTLTPDELRLWAVERLGINALALEQIASDGPLTASKAASLLLNRTAHVTSNTIERLSALDPSVVERIAEEVRNLTAITAGDYAYFTDDRLVMLYEYLAREDKPADVRIEACCNWSNCAGSPAQQEELLLRAANLSRAFGGMRQHAPFVMLRRMYMEHGKYRHALSVCKERLAYLDAGSEIPYAASVRGGLLYDSVLCLSALGHQEEAEKLLKTIRTRQDVSEQYQRIFNSEEFLREVSTYGEIGRQPITN